jgi:hypothetical protein
MFAVRFVSLIALAVWIGGTIAAIVAAGGVPNDLGLRARGVASICGGVVLVALFVAKFVGPPPRHFPLRASIAAIMLGVAIFADLRHITSNAPATIEIVLGLVLLSWYARE